MVRVVGREAHAVHQDLPLVERAEIRRLRIAEPNDAEQLVVGRIDDRHRVGELLGGIDAVVVAHRDVGRRTPRRAPGRPMARRAAGPAEKTAMPSDGDSSGSSLRSYSLAVRHRTVRPSTTARRSDLRRRRGRGRQSLAEREPHRDDFLLLVDDDFLRDPPQLLVMAVAQLRLRHVDRALVVRDHHGGEVAVDVAGRLDVMPAIILSMADRSPPETAPRPPGCAAYSDLYRSVYVIAVRRILRQANDVAATDAVSPRHPRE